MNQYLRIMRGHVDGSLLFYLSPSGEVRSLDLYRDWKARYAELERMPDLPPGWEGYVS